MADASQQVYPDDQDSCFRTCRFLSACEFVFNQTSTAYRGAFRFLNTHLCTQGGGLTHIGNSCFLNAVMQCNLRAPPFSKLLRSGKFGNRSWMLTDQNLLKELLRNQLLNLPTRPQAHYDQLKGMPEYVPIFRITVLLECLFGAMKR